MADRLIRLGRVTGAHGIRGALKVLFYSGSVDALQSSLMEGSRRLFLTDGQAVRPYRIKAVKPHKGGAAIVEVEGVESREEARDLSGQEIALPEAELAPLAEDEFYWFQLLGLEVATETGEDLGRVREIINTGANDVLVVRRDGGHEVLLPATLDVVKRVDLNAGRITVELPEGLLE